MKKLFASLGLMFALLSPGMTLAQDAAAPAPVEETVAVEATEAVAVEAPAADAAAPAEAAPAEPAAEAAPPVADKGDTAWMLTATVLVILMTIPGLALFYGGLVRSKNVLSVLMHVFAIFCVAAIIWAVYGYSLAFTGGGSLNSFIGGLDKMFLKGITMDSTLETFTAGVVIPEYVFVAFQLTFAAITPALIVGAFAERIKFSSLIVFTVLWLTIVYFPMAHMVWFWGGPSAYQDPAGFIFSKGALDFAGGTVVHINSGIAALMAAIVVGKRIGFGREAMTPHNLTMTLTGACLLWVGWFGFNVGSGLEANGLAGQVFINTLLATAAAALSWMFAEWMLKGKASMLGIASGAIAGLVAITPACGWAGPMGSIILGAVAGAVCLWGVTGLKKMLGVDDALDVFGIHGLGGIVGALGVAFVASPSMGGTGVWDYAANAFNPDYSIGTQFVSQAWGVGVALVWSGVVSFILFKLIDMTMGLRVAEEQEREGLDVASHGERAYTL